MSCQSNNATPPGPAVAPGAEAIDGARAAERAAERGMDPRVTAAVPGFDAPFFQAGLCGYSDAAMRIIARRHGCPFCVTEALLDRTLLAGGRGFAKADLGDIADNVPGGDEDHPLAGQIMGSDPREMGAAALKMVEQGRRRAREYRRMAYELEGVHPGTESSKREAQGSNGEPGGVAQSGSALRIHLRLPGGEQIGWYDPLSDGDTGSDSEQRTANSERTFATIDVNLACPVKKVDRKARGGHWLAEPEGAVALLEAVREATPPDIPCTVKLRRAYDDTPEMAESFERILDAAFRIGYAWATVHARTVEQRYVGPSRWDILRDIVRRHPDKVIFGSGDVWAAADIFRMLAYTGVSAVAVARGCIGNPWIFRQARAMMAGEPPAAPTLHEQRAVLQEHFELALRVNSAGGGSERKAEVFTGRTMRKFGIRFAEFHPRADEVRQRFIAVEGLEAWRAVLDEFYGDDATRHAPVADAAAV